MHHEPTRLLQTESQVLMGLFKPDLYRFFTIGFAVGALFVVATVDGGIGALTDTVFPAAEAQPAP
ncbi:MAG: hypothetical protein R3D89_05290 [Sphingomonadaceae bacterium]